MSMHYWHIVRNLVKMNESEDMRIIKDVHALLAQI